MIESIRERLATAERHKAELMERNANLHAAKEAALADAAALREQLLIAEFDRDANRQAAEEFSRALEENRTTLAAYLAGGRATRERVTRAEALLRRWVDGGGQAPREEAATHIDTVEFLKPLVPTEPDGASGNRQGDDK